MSNEPIDVPSPTPAIPTKSTAVLMITAAVAMVAFMAFHPTVHHHDPAGFAADMARIATFNAIVHGSLVGILCALTVGMWGLAHHLGLGFLIVRVGAGTYSLGAILLSLAGIINGFVVPGFMERYTTEAGTTVNEWRPILELCHEANNTFSQWGVVGLSVAVLLWSIVLVHRPGASRVLGGLGAILCALLPLTLLAMGRLPMNMHGFGFFVLLQGVFSAAAGIQLLRSRI